MSDSGSNTSDDGFRPAEETPGADTVEGGDGTDAGTAELDALEAEIDADLVDEMATRMASSSSLAAKTSDRVVNMLLRQDRAAPGQIQTAREQREEEGTDEALWRVLARLEDMDRQVVYETAARIYAFPVADLQAHPFDADFTRAAMEDFPQEKQSALLEYSVVPHRVESGVREVTYLVTPDPMRREVQQLVQTLDLGEFTLQYAPKSDVDALLSEAFPRKNEYLERIQEEDSVDLGQSFEQNDELIDEEKLEAEINRSSLINLFEAALVEAVREEASDIHIVPNAEEEIDIHFRVNGQLSRWHTETRFHPEAFLSVVKDNSMRVDRFESDAAQDGFIQREIDGARIRFRVSVMPIENAGQDVQAESVVIRVLDDRKVITQLSELGFRERVQTQFEEAIHQPHGMVILTGPTGSGKSTTLVASLRRVIEPAVNVLTIEDPVEYLIEGARQVKLSDDLRLKDALRSLLRHDPDVVMVGEMRDDTTAELAIKLANTGHLTFSTLHTNDAPSAVSRLYKMGIEPFLIAYAINLVVAQRLIRTLCPACKQEHTNPDPVLLRQLGFPTEEVQSTTFYRAGDESGCDTCGGTGYVGREAIAEALRFTRPIQHMIVQAEGMVEEDEIRTHAEEHDGMHSLQDSARRVVAAGRTTIAEMKRVVPSGQIQ
jgi:type IV pilus assembly protein PilB